LRPDRLHRGGEPTRCIATLGRMLRVIKCLVVPVADTDVHFALACRLPRRRLEALSQPRLLASAYPT
jgi:hypothetical protein